MFEENKTNDNLQAGIESWKNVWKYGILRAKDPENYARIFMIIIFIIIDGKKLIWHFNKNNGIFIPLRKDLLLNNMEAIIINYFLKPYSEVINHVFKSCQSLCLSKQFC